jgi:hypothetical protein
MRSMMRLPMVLIGALLLGCAESATEPTCASWWGPSISGWVRDQNGAPVNGAWLHLERREDGYSVDQLSIELALGATHFLFFGVSPGTYTLTVRPPRGYVVPESQPNPVRLTIPDSCENPSVYLTISLHRE